MFNSKQAKASQKNYTFVGLGTTISGNIECKGHLRIAGTIIGDLKVEGDLIIGDSAEIIGNVSANNITVGGIVEGNITSTGILKILSTAELNGDINVRGLIAVEGGVFTGKCSLIRPPQKVLEAMFVEKRNRDNTIRNLAVQAVRVQNEKSSPEDRRIFKIIDIVS